jgi:hypothetical protein
MHPRNDLCPRETVFHVTNSGYRWSVDLALELLPSECAPGVVTVVLLDKSEFDEVFDAQEGVVAVLDESDDT